MRFAPAFFVLFLAAPAFAADPELPPAIDLVAKRDALYEAYPPFPTENAMSAIRAYGNAIRAYEQRVIGGWQQEILERCRKVKDFERFINRRNSDGDLSPKAYAANQEDIAAERELCDSRNRATSPLWQLEAELRAMNTERFNAMRAAEARCSRSECRQK